MQFLKDSYKDVFFGYQFRDSISPDFAFEKFWLKKKIIFCYEIKHIHPKYSLENVSTKLS